ncbi:calmodulin, striated muscle-like, partial [Daktulosphaira vitifoliae]|uniref:calmodulin, striated muscle-like n=1 Tax=Daktulosphaira vitifoliae TaxID=58002 RepID=UPI0021AAB38C
SDSVLNDETDEEIILFKEKFNLKKNTNGYVTSEELAIINASDQIHTDKSNNNVSLSDSVLNDETDGEIILYKGKFNLKKDSNGYVTSEKLEIINSSDQLHTDESNDDGSISDSVLNEETVNELKCQFNLKKDTNDHVTLEKLIEIINSFDQLTIDAEDVDYYVKELKYEKKNYDFETCLKFFSNEKLITEKCEEIIEIFTQFSEDGYIDANIVQDLIKSYTSVKSNSYLEKIIKKAYQNNNGKLNFSDFATLMHSL